MLATRLARIDNRHLWLLSLPFALWMFCLQMGQSTVVFSIKKFTDDAAFIAFALVLFRLPGGVFSPVASYASDLTWTAWGRRKPYIVVSGLAGALILPFVSGVSSAWALVGVMLGFQVTIYVLEVFNPLSQELVPLPQRGRASAARAVMFGVSITLFFSVLVGRFDDVYLHGPLASLLGPVTGEQFTYGLGAVLMLLTPLLVGLGVTELRPRAGPPAPAPAAPRAHPLRRARRAVATFFRDLLSRQMLGTSIVVSSSMIATSDLQSFNYLLYTEQWGYSKQEMGSNIALGMAIMLPIIFLGGWLSDRFDRTRAMLAAQALQLAVCLFFIFYVKVWLGNEPPSLLEILIVSEVASITKWITGTMAWPLIFEYAPRDRMGTANAGSSIITAAMISLFILLMGWWIKGYSRLFAAPAGLETCVVLPAPATTTELRAIFGGAVDVRPGPGTGEPTQSWSFRRPSAEVDALLAELKIVDGRVAKLRSASIGASRTDPEAALAGGELARFEQRGAEIRTELESQAQGWTAEVEVRLGQRLDPGGAGWDAAAPDAAHRADLAGHPRVLSSCARSLEYDYFSGYYLYGLQLVLSCLLTTWLISLERRGVVHRQRSTEAPA